MPPPKTRRATPTPLPAPHHHQTPASPKMAIFGDGWGSRSEFQHSYGLGMTPQGFEEGNRILDSFRKSDMQEREEAQKGASGRGGGAAGKHSQQYTNHADSRTMRPTSVSLVGLALATVSAAQTVTLYVPGTDEQPLVASIIGSDATATTYAISCDPGASAQDCGIEGTITLTEGPTTAKYTIAPVIDPNGQTAFAGQVDCSLAGTTSAVCVESFGGSEANFPGVSTETYTGTDQPYMPVTIIAGAVGANRIASPSTTGSGSESTQTSGAGAGAGAAMSTADAKGSGAATTTTDSGPGAASTGAAAAISQGAGWVLGGAAMAMAML
ncbi:hypothetical protein V501_03322 [Pseudogymnoascus sp. VKM F-4519 (FW-2642)]|nr:hypothetical protein V501_03322 [Pseudogymnoascus sp. VKM F-4519 (FW-2642)]